MREHLGYAFFKVAFRNCQHVVVEVWSCNSAWTVDSQQYVLKSCTIAKRVFYPGTRTRGLLVSTLATQRCSGHLGPTAVPTGPSYAQVVSQAH